ncbi:MAG: ComEA family DNA-binding protein [Actinomycetaceae bacterium]
MDRGRSGSAERLRSLTRVAYTAAAGHLEVDPEEGQDRAVRAWPVRRAVLAVLTVLALVVGVLGARYLLTREGPGEELAADGLSVEGGVSDGVSGEAPVDGGEGESGPGGGAEPDGGEGGAGSDGSEDDASTDGAASGTGVDGGAPAGTDPADGGAGTDAGSGAGTDDEAPTGEELRTLPVVVHVAGAVARPGVVALEPGARLGDAVGAAGGALDDADLDAVNLARPLADGEQIYLPAVGEEPRDPLPAPSAGVGGSGGQGAAGTGGAGGSGAGPGGPGSAGTGPGDGAGRDGTATAVNLNQASATELEELPGIGPALAGRIVTHREEIGAFTSVDQLDDVSGIGPVLMDQLRDLVTV